MGNILKKKFGRPEDKPKFRHVIPNHLIPDDLDPKEHPNRSFLSNRIKTTKYTVWSFLPKNLFEQFHRFANLYFLFIVLLNWVPQVNAFAKEVAMIPVIAVLAVTAIKDGYEDYRRYQSDKKVNHQLCRVYSRKERRYNQVEWCDIRIGDIIHLSCNEVIPADLVLLRTSEKNKVCHIDTSNIDGENNLKQRQAVHGIHQGEEFHPTLFTHTVECERPNVDLHKFHGAMLTSLNEKIPINKNNFLLRGCILRNTAFVEGIVVYAGHESKALLNNRGPRYKRSKLERQINRDVIWCVIVLVLMCFLSALGTGLWNAKFPNSMIVPYIPYESLSQYSAPYQGFIRFWTYVILYQVVIPLSLYVTIEVVKLGQVYFINQDLQLYHPKSDKRVECRALNITEDLGLIQYVFSDKTGTLTENEMVFKRCAVGGVGYCNRVSGGPHAINQDLAADAGREGYVNLNLNAKSTVETLVPDPDLQKVVSSMTFTETHITLSEHTKTIWDFFLLLTVCNTVVVSLHGHQDKEIDKDDDRLVMERQPQKTSVELKSYRKLSQMDSSGYVHEDSGIDTQPCRSPPDVIPTNVQGSRHSSPAPGSRDHRSSVKSLLQRQREKLQGIFAPRSRSPILSRQRLENEGCSSGEEGEADVDNDREVTDTDTSMMSESTLKTKYEAESPDELALVQAACSYGCRLLQHTSNCATLWLPREGEVNVRILHTLTFDPERKRMSVIIQHPGTNQLVLYCKGADSAILPNLQTPGPGDDHMIKETEKLLTLYAKDGLRTLCMAKKVLSIKEYEAWLRLHHEAEVALDHRERKLHESACRIENDMELLGVTGIEDRLQDGVADTIASLQAAGIRVWVLTGDKQETALNIAHSCKLMSFDQDMIILNARNKQMTKELLESKLEYLDLLSEPGKVLDPSDVTVAGCRLSGGSRQEREGHRQVALVVDGKTLGYIQQEKACRDNFLKLAQQCSSVLCCRTTPAQKAHMVKMVQEKLKKLTLAIGDGANDVNMIQTADIGIGISGKEGMQAVMASDFALPQFFFLKRLLLVHGHWCYDRLARMTLYMFFKNTVFVILLMWFQLYSGFSGGALTDDMNLILFNLVYTSLPPIVFGIFDKDIRDEALMTQPSLYKQGPNGMVYKKHSYFVCIVDAVWQSLVQFFVPYLAYADSDVGIWEFGIVCVAGCTFCTLMHLCIETRCWNIYHVAVMAISLLLFFGYNLVYSAVVTVGSPPANPHWVYIRAMESPAFWLCSILTVFVALAPRFLVRGLEGTLRPGPSVLSRKHSPAAASEPSQEAVFATWTSSNSRQRYFKQLKEDDGAGESLALQNLAKGASSVA